jgi:hypothetical protein
VSDFPQLDAWIDGLPRGLLSYPECEVKGSILRTMVGEPFFRAMAPRLPDALRFAIESPPLASQWVPEVHQLGLMLAVADAHFASAGGEAAFLGWGDRASLAMLRSPLYRVVFAVGGPKLLLHGLSRRAQTLRRGTTFDLRDQGEGWAIVDFGFPRGLYTTLLLKARARSMRGALEAAGGRQVAVHMTDVGSTRVTFRVEYR